MEIYVNETVSVALEVPVTPADPNAVAVKAYINGVEVYDFPLITASPTGLSVALPFSLVQVSNRLEIRWSFTYLENAISKPFTRSTFVDVIRPYASLAEIKAYLGNDAARFSDAQLRAAERKIRSVVENFTGQKFDMYTGSRTVNGAGDVSLRLQERLLKVNNVTGYNSLQSATPTNGAQYSVLGDGWVLAAAAPSGDGDWVFTNIIRTPDSQWDAPAFKDNFAYVIDGVWGWDSVPSDVTEATLILLGQTLCPDSEYRDRYVTNVQAADWTYEFDSRAFSGTGNVIADQLLSSYQRYSMTVI